MKSTNKDVIKGNFDVLIKHRGMSESSRLFNASKIELLNNHLLVYRGKELIFKVWLQKEGYVDVKKAMNDCDIKVIKF
jgi:hypothetical protein